MKTEDSPSRKKAILISYAFPPLAAPESFLAAKTLANLRDFDIDVITASKDDSLLELDQSLTEYVHQSFKNIYSVPSPHQLFNKKVSPLISKIYSFFAVFPDRAAFLNRNATKMALSMNLKQYSALITWSQFHSSHLVGLAIKKQFPNLPWYAHFSDPWVDNPFNRLKWLSEFWNTSKERQVIEAADKLIFTSDLTLDLVLKKYSAQTKEKAVVIPHPFDESLYHSSAKHDEKKYIFRYLGKFYGPRNPKSLFEALVILKNKFPDLVSKLKFEFIGTGVLTTPPSISDLVFTTQSVDYLTSLKLMQSADILLVIDAPAKQTVFLPSKLVDYLGAKKPVFGITPSGTSRNLIEKMGWRCASPNSPLEIAEKIHHLVLDLESGWESDNPIQMENVRGAYDCRTIRNEMNALMKSNNITLFQS